jgi:hypothetical protein
VAGHYFGKFSIKMRAASLKRKLEELYLSEHATTDALRQIERELHEYKAGEMRIFVGARCARIASFSRQYDETFTFDNGMRGDIGYDFGHIRLYDGEQELGFFSRRYGINWCDRAYDDLSLAKDRVTRIAEILPVIVSLVNDVFPAWLKASKELDVESLMTSRVLRWISKQVGGQWPDIITGNFPLK